MSLAAIRPEALLLSAALGWLACGGTDAEGGAPSPPPPAVAEVSYPPDVVARPRLWRLSEHSHRAAIRAALGEEVALPEVPALASGGGLLEGSDQLVVREELAVQLLTQAATLVDAVPLPRLLALGGCAELGDGGCPGRYVATLAERLFCRPPAAGEVEHLLSLFSEARELTPDDLAGPYRAVLQALLVSPHFLYRTELGALSPHHRGAVVRLTDFEVASLLSFGLLDAPPEGALAADAAAGKLSDPPTFRAWIARLLARPAAEERLRRFLVAWLDLPDLLTVDRDPDRFGGFDTTIRQLMQDEALSFVAARGTISGDLPSFLAGAGPAMDARLAAFYASDPSAPPPERRTARSGVLSLGAVLTANSRFDQSSVVKRGLYLRERLFCQDLSPPPGAVLSSQGPSSAPDTPASAAPGPRAALARHLGDPACQSCHVLIDPLGLPYEAFDAVGRWRTVAAGEPVETRSHIVGTDVDGPVADERELAARLATSADVRRCFVETALRFYLGRPPGEGDRGLLARAAEVLAEGSTFGDLLAVLFSDPGLWYRRWP